MTHKVWVIIYKSQTAWTGQQTVLTNGVIVSKLLASLIFQISFAYSIIHVIADHERFEYLRDHLDRIVEDGILKAHGIPFVYGLILFCGFPCIVLIQNFVAALVMNGFESTKGKLNFEKIKPASLLHDIF